MEQVGGQAQAGAEAMKRFLKKLEKLDPKDCTAAQMAEMALKEGAPAAAVAHIAATLQLALDTTAGPQVAAVFAFGREDVIPDMFRELLPNKHDQATSNFEKRISVFRYYLERHIELDGKDHGPLAIRLVEQLHGQVSS